MLDALNPLRGGVPCTEMGWQVGGFDFFDTGTGIRVGCVEIIACTRSPGSTISTQKPRTGPGVSKKSNRPHHPEKTDGKTNAPHCRLSGRTAPGHNRAHMAIPSVLNPHPLRRR